MRDPKFIKKTSDLTDEEAALLVKEIRKMGEEIAVHFKSADGVHCFNIKNHSEWDRFWGEWKSRLYRMRLRAEYEADKERSKEVIKGILKRHPYGW